MEKRIGRSLFALASLIAASAGGCTPEIPSVTVAGFTLKFVDQSYGKTILNEPVNATFCQPLAKNGQYMLMITDFTLCGILEPPEKKNENKAKFHSSETTHLRIIIPSDTSIIKKVPPVTELGVGKTFKCTTGAGKPAAAFFAHNPPGLRQYDVDEEADGGTVKINFFEAPSNMTGSFDLTFGPTRITGSFNAPYCNSILPGLGE